MPSKTSILPVPYSSQSEYIPEPHKQTSASFLKLHLSSKEVTIQLISYAALTRNSISDCSMYFLCF